MAQGNIVELAKKGDASAIATLMNKSLRPKGVAAQAVRTGNFFFRNYLALPARLESESYAGDSTKGHEELTGGGNRAGTGAIADGGHPYMGK
jgi:hypothetical protein